MALDIDSQLPLLTEEWLTSRTFTFYIHDGAQALSETFLFHTKGFILGYGDTKAAFWEHDGDAVHLLDVNGKITCRMTLLMSKTGSPLLAGLLRDPQANYEETETVQVLFDNGSDYHTRIQSFDMFDTLVARRCFDPREVFRQVEIKSGIENFASRRHLVEMSIFGRRPYGIDDIYAMLIDEKLLTERQAEIVKAMELEEEWDQLIPMAQMVAFVNPDDIIISDMYLPQAFWSACCGKNAAEQQALSQQLRQASPPDLADDRLEPSAAHPLRRQSPCRCRKPAELRHSFSTRHHFQMGTHGRDPASRRACALCPCHPRGTAEGLPS